MADEKTKDIASAVVLAQHGNKNAKRDIYIKYYKDIFFICKMTIGDDAAAIDITEEIFIKMFSSVDKLSDYALFEQWFYALAVNISRAHTRENKENSLIGEKIPGLAEEAVKSAESRDRFSFEHSIMKILEEMIKCLPDDARAMFFYDCFASIPPERIAVIENLSLEDVKIRINALGKLLNKQTEKIREYGTDVSPFVRDIKNSVTYLVAHTFVPNAVHSEVSKALGIDVNPFSAEKPSDNNETAIERAEEAHGDGKKSVKKNFLTKGDFILFIVVAAAALVIFSGVKLYDRLTQNEATTPAISAKSESAPRVWNGSAASSFESGEGTRENPYIIANANQLAYLANLVNDGNSYYASCCYKLSSDIILNDTADYESWSEKPPENTWQPIGYSNSSDDHSYFCGTFDGDDHTISGMYISSDKSYTGLFGIVRNGSVKNLTVKESYVSGSEYTGGIAGYFASDASSGTGFSYCSFSGKVVSSGSNAGGIAGYFRAEGNDNIAGIECCCASGSVKSLNSCAGGITGVGEADTGSVKIINCLNDAAVYAENKSSGGIAGAMRAANGGAIAVSCCNTGKITAKQNADACGGITGNISLASGEGQVNISYCYSLDTAAVRAVPDIPDKRAAVSSVRSLTSDEMQKEESFETFNFSEIWTFGDAPDYGYPTLQGAKFVKLGVEENASNE